MVERKGYHVDVIRQSIADHSVLIHQNNGASSPQQLIVLLHGWGADGSDLIDLAPHLSARFPHAVICAPDGPEPCTADPMGRQWFDLGVMPHKSMKALKSLSGASETVASIDGTISHFR